MTDKTITEDDELIPVETAPVEETDEDKANKQDADDEDDEDDDSRLAQSEDDSDDEVSSHRRRRQQRRDSRKRARERTERELSMVREQNAELQRRLVALESHTVGISEQSAQARLDETLREVQMAESIIAKATEAGNGEDVVAAMRIRDAAQAKAQQIFGEVQQHQQRRQQPQGDDQRARLVAQHAQAWTSANPWYRTDGSDRDSALTKAIDSQLASEGYDPATRGYWEELTARVADAFADNTSGSRDPAPKDTGRRKGPPQGTGREHAPVSTKKEIYVTPERKQAMIDAGAWDDPVKRQRMLKAYRDFDHGSAR